MYEAAVGAVNAAGGTAGAGQTQTVASQEVSETLGSAKSVVSEEFIELFEYMHDAAAGNGQAVDFDIRAFAESLANPETIGESLLKGVEELRVAHDDMMNRINVQGVSVETGPAGGSLNADGLFDGPASYSPASGGAETTSSQASTETQAGDQLQNMLDSMHKDMQDMLELQYHVRSVMAREEMVGSVAGRSSQNMDMLLRGA